MSYDQFLLLTKIETQIRILRKQVLSYDRKLSDQEIKDLQYINRFYIQLFDIEGAQLSHCLQILEHDFQKIKSLYQDEEYVDEFNVLCQRFVDRFSALLRVITLDPREWVKKKKSKEMSYGWIKDHEIRTLAQVKRQLSKHFAWKKQLNEQILVLETKLSEQKLKEKLSVQKEILQLNHRLEKCHGAIQFLQKRYHCMSNDTSLFVE